MTNNEPKYAIVLNPQLRSVQIAEVSTPVKLQELYQIIGCNLVERVYMDDDHSFIIDEEGMYNDELKSMIIKHHVDNYHLFYGTTVIVKDVDADWHGMTMSQVEELTEQIKIKWQIN